MPSRRNSTCDQSRVQPCTWNSLLAFIKAHLPLHALVGADGWAMTPSGMCRVLKMQCHLFHQRHARERVPRPGGAPDPQSRRMAACSGYETTSRCRGSGRRCIGLPETSANSGYVIAALVPSLFDPRVAASAKCRDFKVALLYQRLYTKSIGSLFRVFIFGLFIWKSELKAR